MPFCGAAVPAALGNAGTDELRPDVIIPIL